MYDKAIKDMEAGTGIYDMVYIEQDIIYAYLARNFLVDITKALKDEPIAEGSGLLRGEPHDLRQLLQERRRRPLRRPDGSLHQDLPLSDRPLQRPGDPGRLQGQDRPRPGARDDARGVHGDRRVLHRVGQGHGLDLWGTTAQAHTGHPASWYEFFGVDRPDLRRLQLGHQPGSELRRHGRERRQDEQRTRPRRR